MLVLIYQVSFAPMRRRCRGGRHPSQEHPGAFVADEQIPHDNRLSHRWPRCILRVSWSPTSIALHVSSAKHRHSRALNAVAARMRCRFACNRSPRGARGQRSACAQLGGNLGQGRGRRTCPAKRSPPASPIARRGTCSTAWVRSRRMQGGCGLARPPKLRSARNQLSSRPCPLFAGQVGRRGVVAGVCDATA